MFLLLLILWIIFNGKVTAEIVIIGAAAAALVYMFAVKFLDYSFRKEFKYYGMILYALGYVGLLFYEIIAACAGVIKIMLFKKQKLHPVLVSFESGLKSDFAKVVLANSITLTPGTITVTLEEDSFKVHCLDKSLSEGLADSRMAAYLKKAEERL